MRIYVASSWRNQEQPAVVAALRSLGHEVYDFRHPAPGNNGFAWSAIDPEWQNWTPEAFARALHHPVAVQGFRFDITALQACEVCVLLLPSGRSAHLEAGWAAGAGKRVVVYAPEKVEPELMYRMTDRVVTSLPALKAALNEQTSGVAVQADHPFKPGPDGRCEQIVEGWGWTAFDPVRCRRPECEHPDATGLPREGRQ